MLKRSWCINSGFPLQWAGVAGKLAKTGLAGCIFVVDFHWLWC
jgi:hypothetical protein